MVIILASTEGTKNPGFQSENGTQLFQSLISKGFVALSEVLRRAPMCDGEGQPLSRPSKWLASLESLPGCPAGGRNPMSVAGEGHKQVLDTCVK